MYDYKWIISVITSSLGISAFIYFILKSLTKKSIETAFDKKLEQFKIELGSEKEKELLALRISLEKEKEREAESFKNELTSSFQIKINELQNELQQGRERKIIVFDKQFDAFREIVESVYRIRNVIKKFRDDLTKIDIKNHYEINDILNSFNSEVDAAHGELPRRYNENKVLENLIRGPLYRYRLFIPTYIFDLAHDMSHKIRELEETIYRYKNNLENPKLTRMDSFNNFYSKLDEIDKEIDLSYKQIVEMSKEHFKIDDNNEI